MYNATSAYGSMHSIHVLLEGQGSQLVDACGQGEALDHRVDQVYIELTSWRVVWERKQDSIHSR